jgi:hypothetical protein
LRHISHSRIITVDVRGDGKGTQYLGVYLGHPVPGGYKYGDLALQVWEVSKIGAIKYGLESRGTQIREALRWRGPAATVNYRPVLSSERALQITNHNCLKTISRRKKLVADPRWVPDTKMDWPTDCRSQFKFDFDFDLNFSIMI